jgi:hypothetical protein
MIRWARLGAVPVCAAVVLALSAGAEPVASPASPESSMSPVARRYLDNALHILQTNAIDRHRVDWAAQTRRAYRLAAGARLPVDTYPAIQQAIDALGNPHTFFFWPSEAADWTTAAPTRLPAGRAIASTLGYLNVPGVHGSKETFVEYVRVGAAAVRDVDRSSPCGWIVDLRDDDGGNMYAMLTILAPLLGDGILGYFEDADGNRTPFGLRGGALLEEPPEEYRTPANPYRLSRPDPPVAVLTGPNTGSAGEAVLIAFKGRPDTRVFGRPTAGFATGNDGFTFSDGALLLLTMANDVDRTGVVYRNVPIPPDQAVAETVGSDAAVLAAAAWLKEQPRCRRG